MFGRVDENDPPGILREKGFGVEFPNYIVDVKKDPQTGEVYYKYFCFVEYFANSS